MIQFGMIQPEGSIVSEIQ